MFKTRYTVTTEGSTTVVRRVGKSRTSVVARRIAFRRSEPAQGTGNGVSERPQRPGRKKRR